jgi:baculoviral IAP repeat-containing protein 7/8
MPPSPRAMRVIKTKLASKLIPASRFKSEQARLDSFKDFNYRVSKEDLAATGFFYIGVDDKVQCAFCCVVLGDFVDGDVPSQEHSKYASRCPFICGLPVGNIPKLVDENSEDVDEHAILLQNKINELEALIELKSKCKICLTNDLDTVLFPCCHLATCQSCSNRVQACPICRGAISGKVKVFCS